MHKQYTCICMFSSGLLKLAIALQRLVASTFRFFSANVDTVSTFTTRCVLPVKVRYIPHKTNHYVNDTGQECERKHGNYDE